LVAPFLRAHRRVRSDEQVSDDLALRAALDPASHGYDWRVTTGWRSRRLTPVRWLFLFFFVLVLIGGGMKLAGMQLPIFDYPLGGPMTQPQVEIQQPDLNLP
jgi:hypothetical protein